MNPYDALGIPRDATPEQVKAAYRRQAQKWHPDRDGGDEAKFKAAKVAYEILSDAERRSRFDETGHDDQLDARMATLRNAVVTLMFSYIDSAIDMRSDVWAMMVAHVAQTGQSLRAEIETEKKRIIRYQVATRRFKRRRQEGDNIFAVALEKRIAECEARILDIRENIELNREVLRLLDDYVYDTAMQDDIRTALGQTMKLPSP